MDGGQRRRLRDVARELRIPSQQLLEELDKAGIFVADDNAYLKSHVVAKLCAALGKTALHHESLDDEFRTSSGTGAPNKESTERSSQRRPTATAGRHMPGARGRNSRTASRPSPGEIWWARISFVDDDGRERSNVRPCIVVRLRASGAEVVQSTSNCRPGHPDYLPLPTYDWDLGGSTECSWIDLGKTRFVADSNFARRAKEFCGTWLWDKIRERFPG